MASQIPHSSFRGVPRAFAYGAGLIAGTWATYSAATWFRYGHARTPSDNERDPLLDGFMPGYEVVERHRVHVAAPADVTYRVACDLDMQQSAVINALFRAREVMMGAKQDTTARPRGLLAFTRSIGWGVLAEVPGQEVVVGAITQPWQPDVVFNALPADRFAGFNEPGYVKIAWTLRVDPTGPTDSVARTETRAVATDPWARRRFRWYWSIYSPGIVLIRRVALQLVKAEAERHVGEPLWQH